MPLLPITPINVSGDLTSDTVGELLAGIDAACRGHRVHLVLNLKEAREVDPHGLGALIRGLKAARDAGGDLSLGEVSDELAQMLAITGLGQVLSPAPAVPRTG